MVAFQTAVDIANRALQHCGSGRISQTAGFAENSKNASETSFVYDKLRRAELRRNVWRFATRRTALRALDTTTMLLSPAMWVANTTYFVGSIVSDESGNLWVSRIPSNIGNQPQNSLTWEMYFGPMTVSLYSSGMAYYAGEIVYTAAGDGTNRVYVSLQNSNTDVPATATAWDATVTYFKNQVVTYLSVAYMSLIDLNIAKTPTGSPALWDVGTTYAIGNQVGGSDGMIYTSSTNGNIGNDPVADGGAHWTSTGILNQWTTVFVGGSGSDKWLQVGGAEFPMGVTLSSMNIVYPLGAGPSSQSSTGNVFRLPVGFLREAPQGPKIGSNTSLGGPSGLTYNDWTFEGNFLVTTDGGPIVFRFVADVTDVTGMDDMFCEGLAARVAMEVCEPLTQSSAKLGVIAKVYDEWMSQARTINGIETGYDDPPDDEYVSVRW